MSKFSLCKLIISSKGGAFDTTVLNVARTLGLLVAEENQDPVDNVAEADATLVFDIAIPKGASGPKPTIVRAMNSAWDQQKPCLVVTSTSKARHDQHLCAAFLSEHKVRSLNVVGLNSWDKQVLAGVREFLLSELPIPGLVEEEEE